MHEMTPQLKSRIEYELLSKYGCSPKEATDKQFYGATCSAVLHFLQERRASYLKKCENKETKKVYYFSMEFLQGRSLKNNLYNLQMEAAVKESLSDFGVSLDTLYEMEPDAGLGNGGLGRLASCYMDGLASCGYPAEGFSICYEFGIFKQEIVDGWQMEFPDNWLEMGSHWLLPRPMETVEVRFDGYVEEKWTANGLQTVHSGYDTIRAVPYDMLIPGYGGECINNLRLWRAEAKNNFDMAAFSRGEYVRSMENDARAEAISKVLYPADDHIEGKTLRLKQQYFFVSASLQTILSRHLAAEGTLDNLADHVVIHINDTHPALCVPELMRLLMDEHGYSWDAAWEIVHNCTAYTNHTVMSEALETWPVDLFRARLPRVYSIVEEINRRFCHMLYEKHPEMRGKINQLAIVADGRVKMANLCVCSCFSVNGVSKLHSDILKTDLFADYNTLYPGKFTNVTNGIAHRRWLCQSNPLLYQYLKELLPGNDFERDLSALRELDKYQDDTTVLAHLAEIKHKNKERLANYIAKANGIAVDPSSIFDIQVKRLHEYKRQLLNALHIYDLYVRIKYVGLKIHPRTFLFGAKASAGYYMAKEIIRFICALANMINTDPDVRDMMRVVFLSDYRVSLAEIIMPAADISEQISQAGKEASGTGNMKLMLGGAVTMGTMDGANVEIFEQVGEENIFIFGMRTPEVEDLAAKGYDPQEVLAKDPGLAALIDRIANGGVNGLRFDAIVNNLRYQDPYMTLADFRSYQATQQLAGETYENRTKWQKMSLINTAHAGLFAADRSVRDYAENIWHTKSILD